MACGVRIPSSINACKLRPPYLIDRFQSLLDPRPQMFSNSLGVYHASLCLIHFPRPPEPSRLLYRSPVVVLHRTGRTSRLFSRSITLLSIRYSCCDWFWWSTRLCSSCVAVTCCCWSVPCCWITICVGLRSPVRSPTTVLPDTKPLLSTQIIGLKCWI